MVFVMNLSVRNVDEETVRRFKAKAAAKNLNMGKALTLAMRDWIESKKGEKIQNLLDIEPIDWGPGSENSSMEVDKILYGE